MNIQAQKADLPLTLWREGDRLRFSAPAGTITAEAKKTLSEVKEPILEFLAAEAVEEEADRAAGRIVQALAADGVVVIQADHLDGERMVWTADRYTRIPADLQDLPVFTYGELVKYQDAPLELWLALVRIKKTMPARTIWIR